MWSPRWNDIYRGKQKDSEKNLSQCHFVYHRRRGERPAFNRLSHGTVSSTEYLGAVSKWDIASLERRLADWKPEVENMFLSANKLIRKLTSVGYICYVSNLREILKCVL
jgi:hypothetical protein